MRFFSIIYAAPIEDLESSDKKNNNHKKTLKNGLICNHT